MKVLLAIASDRFMDEAYTIPKAALEAAGAECVTASVVKGTCYGMHGEIVEANVAFTDVNADEFDGIVISGGIGCQDQLWRNEELIDIANKIGNTGTFAAAICLAPVILGEAGLLNGKKATTLPTPACLRVLQLDNAEVLADNVVVDGNIITAKSPFDAKAFAEAIISVIQ